jgi:tetratricopeptide (TPR) repeat protein
MNMKKPLVTSTVILLLLFSIESAILENTCEIANPVAYEIEYVVLISNDGPGTITQIDVWIPVMHAYQSYQLVDSWSSNPKPLEIIEDESKNKLAHIRLKETIAPGENAAIRIRCKVQIYAVSCNPVTSTCGKYDKDAELYKKYTAPEKHIESDNQKIKEKAAEIAGDTNDPYAAAKKIYEFVLSHMSYVRFDRCRGALYALEEKKGDCTEFSDLFVALCRARGIPARSVHGFTYKSSGIDQLHDWAEVYIPDGGWIPVDATWGRQGKDYFGNTTNTHILLYTGRYLSVEKKEFSFYYFTYRFTGKPPKVTHSLTPHVTKTMIWYQDPTILNQAETLSSEGETCHEKGDYETAKVKFQKAKELYEKLGDSSTAKLYEATILLADAGIKAHSLLSEALNSFEKKMYTEAKQLFNQAKSLYSMAGNKQKVRECDTYIATCDTGIEAGTLFEKGKAHIKEGTYDEAKLSFEKAEKKYEEIGDTEKVQQCQKEIEEIEKRKKESEPAKDPEKGACLGTLFVVLIVVCSCITGHKRV